MDDIVSTLALTFGVGWAAGINLYAVILVLGLLGATGYLELPAGLALLADPLVIAAAGFMYLVEFFADKVPGVDTGWDTLHTFVRIPAGALLAAGAVGDVGPAVEIAAAVVGGSLAAATHAAKAGTRVLINTSPEPFTNWGASVAEDLGVFGGLLLALTHPGVFLVALALFVVLLVWLLPKLWRGLRQLFRSLGRLFGLGRDRPAEADESAGSVAAGPGERPSHRGQR
ncbi:DUF4126 domain-containing protein [Thioalkalicoccus limnaeus]|uniref:DUF4126 domain-containing protein n=1 Tax=Thioalkalicoccus limnaeus TaxID=120681 RepID=A0ABV4BDN6_9GAMM